MPRLFLNVAPGVGAAVASAHGYRVYQNGQCCNRPLPRADGSQPTAPLWLILPAQQAPAPQQVALAE